MLRFVLLAILAIGLIGAEARAQGPVNRFFNGVQERRLERLFALGAARRGVPVDLVDRDGDGDIDVRRANQFGFANHGIYNAGFSGGAFYGGSAIIRGGHVIQSGGCGAGFSTLPHVIVPQCTIRFVPQIHCGGGGVVSNGCSGARGRGCR